jgi:hypothetical protein
MSATRQEHPPTSPPTDHGAVHGDRGAVEPTTQLTLSLLLSLALWAPSGMAVLDGDLDLTGAGLRYLIAFLGCRFAIGGIASLITTYHRIQAEHHGGPAIAAAGASGPSGGTEHPLRRREDLGVDPVSSDHAG